MIRAGGRTTLFAVVAICFGLAAGAMIVLFAAVEAWAALIVIVPLVLAVAFAAWRASRCRLEIWPEQLVVVNSFTTCRIRREELLGVAEQDWSNLADTTRTIELRTVDGGVVRVSALARVSQTSAELRHHAERIDQWRAAVAP